MHERPEEAQREEVGDAEFNARAAADASVSGLLRLEKTQRPLHPCRCSGLWIAYDCQAIAKNEHRCLPTLLALLLQRHAWCCKVLRGAPEWCRVLQRVQQ